MLLLDKLDEPAARRWYAAQALENGWSRKLLQAHIASDLRARQGNAISSFDQPCRCVHVDRGAASPTTAQKAVQSELC